MLQQLSVYLLERVLSHLCPKDYVELCLVSRLFHQSTSDYLEHVMLSSEKDERIKQFFAANEKLLLPYERKLYEALLKVSSTFSEDNLYRLPLFQEMMNNVESSDDIVRVSITKSHVFGYLGDMNHVFVKYCEKLKREVVYLNEISWLIFSTNLPKFHSQSYPASYRIRMHFQVRSDVVWKGDKPMAIRLVNRIRDEVVRHYFIHPGVWKTVTLGEKLDLAYNNYNDKNLKIERSAIASWFFLVIDDVYVEEEDELCFTIDDRQNVFWKSGKSWDFLEILKIK